MRLYLLSQSVNSGYDTYDSAVVAAPNERAARLIHPGRYSRERWWEDHWSVSSWANPGELKVEFLGNTKREAGVVCASFNAG